MHNSNNNNNNNESTGRSHSTPPPREAGRGTPPPVVLRLHQMLPLHQRLRELIDAHSRGVLSTDEYAAAKAAMLADLSHDATTTTTTTTADGVGGAAPAVSEHRTRPATATTPATAKKSASAASVAAAAAPPQAAAAAQPSSSSSAAEEDPADDVFPLPFACRRGATTRADQERQAFHNAEMWEVFRAHPAWPAAEREREVARRQSLRDGVASLRSRVNRLSKAVARRAGCATAAAAAATSDEAFQLVQRLSELRLSLREEHDQALSTVVPALPAALVGPTDQQRQVFDRKPHLFRFLRTADVATVDAHLVLLLSQSLSLVSHLLRRAKACFETLSDTTPAAAAAAAGGMGHGKGSARGDPTSVLRASAGAGSCDVLSTGGNTPPETLTLSAWRKFARSASKEFKEAELRLVSEETLQSLLLHFGRALTQTERHWVFMQWRGYQKKKKTAVAASGGPPPPPPPPPQAPPLNAEAVLQQQRLQGQLAVLREGEEERELRRRAEAAVRAEYEDVVRRCLEENQRLIGERNASEAALVEDLVHSVERDCREAHEAERGELATRVKTLLAQNATLRRELAEAAEAGATAADAAAASARADAARGAQKMLAEELCEVRSMRAGHERELRVLRGQLEVCAEQSTRLSTELESTLAGRAAEELKDLARREVEAEYLARLEAKEADLSRSHSLVATLHAQLAEQRRAAEEAAESQRLFRECVAEMRHASSLSVQRGDLIDRMGATYERVRALSKDGEDRYAEFFECHVPVFFSLFFFKIHIPPPTQPQRRLQHTSIQGSIRASSQSCAAAGRREQRDWRTRGWW